MATGEQNIFYGPLERLRQTVAATPAFQNLIEAAGSPAEKLTAALARVHIVGLAGDAVADARPYVEIDAGPEFEAYKNSSSGRATSGSLWLLLEADVPEDKRTGYADAARWFYEITGNLIEELLDDSLAIDPPPHNLTVRAVSLFDGPPAREDPKANRGDYYQVILTIQWGLAR